MKYAFYDNMPHGTIAAAGGEVTLPTGKETEGLGGGVTIFEAFGMFDQALPLDSFLQIHAGFERPADHAIEVNSAYWRTAIGKTIRQNRWGRTWTPMVEVLAAKEMTSGAKIEWDVVPADAGEPQRLSACVARRGRAAAGQRAADARQGGDGLPALGLVRRRPVRLVEGAFDASRPVLA